MLPILGAPDFVRRDGSAQIWQYRATNCVLDLFLYKNGNETHVKHAEIRPRVPGAESVDSLLFADAPGAQGQARRVTGRD